MTLGRKMFRNTVGEKFQQQSDDILDALSEETTVDSLDQIASRAAFAGEAVVIGEDGITLDGTATGYETNRVITWVDESGNDLGSLQGLVSNGKGSIFLYGNFDLSTTEGKFGIEAFASTGTVASIVGIMSSATVGEMSHKVRGVEIFRVASVDGSTLEAVINEGGNATVDFRVEGDTMDVVKVDASENRLELAGRQRDIRENKQIASNAITITSKWQHLQSESSTTDFLDTITGGITGETVRITAQSGHTITVRDAVDNIRLNGSTNKTVGSGDVLLMYFNGSTWQQESYSNN